ELDRDEIDFSLEVTSAGATSPLEHARQFKKNIGRSLEIRTTDNTKYVANLVKADDEAITLQWKAREPKPIGKGKITVKKEAVLNYNEIEQAKVKIKF
ncbi:MAG: ribosome assembly cofactor RimP, partial [Flavobacteriaceae bacterium]|nr:ribosome assembly cofactor RimP [Flavobacteriaceae bacterium]